MRLAQLHEAQTAVSFDSLADRIQSECSDVLKLYLRTYSVFLRGEQSVQHPAFKSDIRSSRRPLQMEPDQHAAIKKAFELLKLPVTRDNAIFCTTDSDITRPWGAPYIIFPTNGWTGLVFAGVKHGYVFSNLQADILPAARDGGAYEPEKIADGLSDLRPKLFTAETADPIFDSHYQDVLITGRSYYGISTDSRESEELLKQLGFKIVHQSLNNISLDY